MSKTAEEILRQELNLAAVKHGEDPVLNEDWDDWKDEQGPDFMEVMWSSYSQFAAQEVAKEVEAYKKRLKDKFDSCSSTPLETFQLSKIKQLINTVK